MKPGRDPAKPVRSVCLVLLLIFHAAAPADVYTGKELLRACKTPVTAAEEEACSAWAEWGSMSPYFCVPQELGRDEIIAALVKWMEENSGKLHMPGGALVQNALLEAFPCTD